MPADALELAIQHRDAVESAAVDPDAYFGEDAPEGYATSADVQIADLISRLETAQAAANDHRDAAAARVALNRLRKAWGLSDGQ